MFTCKEIVAYEGVEGLTQVPAASEWENLQVNGDVWLLNPGNMLAGFSHCQ